MATKKKNQRISANKANIASITKQINNFELKALNHINNQEFDFAYSIYLKVLNLGHPSVTALANLGAIAVMKADYDNAIKFLEKAITKDKNYLDAWINLGIALKAKNQLQDAHACFNKAIEIDPNNAIIHNNIGITYKRLNNIEAAIFHYSKAAELDSNYFEAYFNLAIAYQAINNDKGALENYQNTLKINKNYKQAHNNLGLLYKDSGNITEAIECFQQALLIDQFYCDAISSLADTYNYVEKYELAIKTYKKILEIDEGNIITHLKIAENFKQLKQYQSAFDQLQLARKYAPYDINVLNEIGVIEMDLNNINKSIAIFETALTINSDHPGILSNLAMALQDKGELTKANELYRKAILIYPQHPEANHNLGLLLLLNGNYQEGWQYHEWRFAGKEQKLPARPNCEPLKVFNLNPKLNLLVMAEQGLGDTLQFMRYIPLLKKQVNKLYFCAQPPLESIIKSSGINDNFLLLDQAMQIKDAVWMPLLSIPMHLNIEPNNVIANEPYIHTPASLIDKWRKKLCNENHLIIAINWQGNPNAEKSNNKNRSIPLKIFEALSTIPNIKLLSLQKGYGSEQLDDCSFRHKFVSIQNDISNTWDFCETAAIIKCCNLVITSDTSIAHLAAALGHPTWLLIKKIPDWRWGLDTESSFWYPSMRIFRQEQQGDWQALMQRVKEELLKFISLIS